MNTISIFAGHQKNKKKDVKFHEIGTSIPISNKLLEKLDILERMYIDTVEDILSSDDPIRNLSELLPNTFKKKESQTAQELIIQKQQKEIESLNNQLTELRGQELDRIHKAVEKRKKELYRFFDNNKKYKYNDKQNYFLENICIPEDCTANEKHRLLGESKVICICGNKCPYYCYSAHLKSPMHLNFMSVFFQKTQPSC